MKILLVSDEECLYLWDYYRPGRLDGIDLIISCGDLNAEYLSFLVTMGRAPVLYVHGNHDGGYERHPPEGCTCIEDQVVNVCGLRILGLGGSPWYSGGPHQYTEREMERRIRRLRFRLRRAGGVDMIVTHAPARGYGDEDNPAHLGFAAFLPLLDQYQPKYLVHGHVHTRYGVGRPRVLQRGNTTIINACERYLLEVPDLPLEAQNLKKSEFRPFLFASCGTVWYDKLQFYLRLADAKVPGGHRFHGITKIIRQFFCGKVPSRSPGRFPTEEKQKNAR